MTDATVEQQGESKRRREHPEVPQAADSGGSSSSSESSTDAEMGLGGPTQRIQGQKQQSVKDVTPLHRVPSDDGPAIDGTGPSCDPISNSDHSNHGTVPSTSDHDARATNFPFPFPLLLFPLPFSLPFSLPFFPLPFPFPFTFPSFLVAVSGLYSLTQSPHPKPFSFSG